MDNNNGGQSLRTRAVPGKGECSQALVSCVSFSLIPTAIFGDAAMSRGRQSQLVVRERDSVIAEGPSLPASFAAH